MSDFGEMVLIVGAFVLFFFGGCCTGSRIGRDVERQAAVQAGAAEWVADPKTGEAEFRYKAEGR